ncbi:programmed cell death protein 7 [Onthophagus taurus]|uniref:programmed cell death protein 7 n=1 Tax=Onthophagus taurus TaxID=166361 RepID=UPI0039BEA7FC
MSNYYDFVNPTANTFHSLDPRLNYNLNNQTNKDSLLHFAESQNFDLTLPLKEIVDQKTDDELFIETWLSKIGKIQINLDSTINITQTQPKKVSQPLIKSPIKISSAKQSLKKCLEIIAKLEETQLELKSNVETMSTNDWKRKTVEIGNLKHEFTTLMAQFETHSLKQLKRIVSKRSKKRLTQKSRKANKKLERNLRLENHRKAHKEIDDWLENMKDTVERAKAEENMKKDADCVLAEVTKKKSDARKQLSLISALIKLRMVRENICTQRGEKTSLEDKSAFNITTERLTNMWEDMSKVYAKEEQGLKVMLEKNASGDQLNGLKRSDQLIRDWERCIFGPKFVPNQAYYGLTSAEKNMETFIAIRKSWDTFLDRGSEGAKIPIGWVLPNENALDGWTKYLCEGI